jgi:hypothetical protein
MIGFALLLVQHTFPDIFRLDVAEVGKSQSRKAAQDKHIAEAGPFRMGAQVYLIQRSDLGSRAMAGWSALDQKGKKSGTWFWACLFNIIVWDDLSQDISNG